MDLTGVDVYAQARDEPNSGVTPSPMYNQPTEEIRPLICPKHWCATYRFGVVFITPHCAGSGATASHQRSSLQRYERPPAAWMVKTFDSLRTKRPSQSVGVSQAAMRSRCPPCVHPARIHALLSRADAVLQVLDLAILSCRMVTASLPAHEVPQMRREQKSSA